MTPADAATLSSPGALEAPGSEVRRAPAGPPEEFGPMRTRDLIGAALASIGIWWASTVVLIFFNFIPGAGPWVALTSFVLAATGGTWLIRNRDRTGRAAAYLSFTSGLLVWGFAESSFYSGLIVGPDLGAIEVTGPNWASFRHVLGLSIYHELLALGLAIVAIVQARKAKNPFGFYVFLMLFFFHQSAKLNVFFGVVNTGAEMLPETVAALRPHMTEATMNPLFPISITVITIVGWRMFRHSLNESLPRWRRVGYVLIGTMAALALLEHWFLMIPFEGSGVGLPGHSH